MKKLLLILFLSLFLAACSASESDEAQEVDSAELEQACLDEGGIFIAEHDECEDISEDACTALGGEYDACASACRHEPEDMICTAQCVLVCSFDSDS